MGGRPGFSLLAGIHGGQQADDFRVEAALCLGERLQLAVHLVAQPAQGRAVVVQGELLADRTLSGLDAAHQTRQGAIGLVQAEFPHHVVDLGAEGVGQIAVGCIEFAHQAGQGTFRVIERELAKDDRLLGFQHIADRLAHGGQKAVAFGGVQEGQEG
ncbi:hypothetical protein SDC9_177606 [bioreactor metagenome]|uniref:Uncharacterized protein n=1 Tax=bioreactor metagenome TaxID=1076179 RepID=A0A645GTG5_9ZZZZ